MNHISFGSVLKEARISKGYELNAVSRRLRIRPDILEAIENSDFDACLHVAIRATYDQCLCAFPWSECE